MRVIRWPLSARQWGSNIYLDDKDAILSGLGSISDIVSRQLRLANEDCTLIKWKVVPAQQIGKNRGSNGTVAQWTVHL